MYTVIEPQKKGRFLCYFREKEHGLYHTILEGPPCEWSRERGATHTLDCGEGIGRGTRPARLLKTVLYVGIDEDPTDTIVWEKWQGRIA